MRILVPIDGNEISENAVDFIASRTTLLGSNPEIEILNVQLPLPTRACRLVGQDSLQRYYEDEAEKVFQPVREKLAKVDFHANEAFLVGDPSDAITEEAQKNQRRLDRHGLAWPKHLERTLLWLRLQWRVSQEQMPGHDLA